VKVPVENTGERAGAEVVELYVSPPAGGGAARPAEELKAFGKVFLAPGETKDVDLSFKKELLAYWDPAGRAWTITPGHYTLRMGESSVDAGKVATLTIP